MLKPILTLLLTVLMAISLAACGGPSPSPSETEDKKDASMPPAASSEVVDTILHSFSAKAFREGAIPDDVLEAILQSGQKAPSAMNLQPWHFTVIRDPEIAGSLASRDYREGGVVVVVSGQPNERAGVNIAFDCALATQNMYLAAQALGLGAHLYFGGVQNINDNLKGTLSIPDGYEAQIFMLVGYLDDSVDAVASASIRNSLSDQVNYVD